MRIKFLEGDFSVCRVRDLSGVNTAAAFFFLARTPDELSLACLTEDVPADAEKADHGWRAFRVEGQLDFALVGILAGLAGTLAAWGISIFAVSSYDTDYILIKAAKADEARRALAEAGYEVA
ncbi:MAG: ACT domain-containing protein [Planctomycetota bacterium]|jgi:hypothetical protein|nr:ACT domain-containing protein [Planctomycetota bacterium]